MTILFTNTQQDAFIHTCSSSVTIHSWLAGIEQSVSDSMYNRLVMWLGRDHMHQMNGYNLVNQEAVPCMGEDTLRILNGSSGNVGLNYFRCVDDSASSFRVSVETTFTGSLRSIGGVKRIAAPFHTRVIGGELDGIKIGHLSREEANRGHDHIIETINERRVNCHCRNKTICHELTQISSRWGLL